MRIGDTLRKAASLLIEFPEESAANTESLKYEDMDAASTPAPAPPSQTIEALVREKPGPNLDEITVPENTPPPSPAPDGKPDFTNIYKLANLPVSPFTAEQVLDLIHSFPAELPLDTKRQTVKVTLNAMSKTMGVTTEIIIADASRKLAALSAFADSYSKQAADFITKSEAAISDLQSQIEAKKAAIENAKVQQNHIGQVCHGESDRLDEVLEFFSLDVPPSKYAPPQPKD